MKVTIVGGGITGCIAALHSARMGHEVTLFEKSKDLGGVLLDFKIDDELYFNGCQYLESGSVEQIGNLDEFYSFPHEYGSITSLGNSQLRILDDCAQPSLDGNIKINDSHIINQSAFQRLSSYGEVTKELVKWAQGFGDLRQLDWRCLIPMQISRIYFPDDPSIEKLKIENPIADELLAIPRRKRGIFVEQAWLPKSGFSLLFLKLETTMRKHSIKIHRNSPVKIDYLNNNCLISSRAKNISTDIVVWTANPTPLFSRLYGNRLDTPGVNVKILIGDLKKDLNIISLPYYWQIFDISSCIFRLYVYELEGCLRFTAEAFNEEDDDKAWSDLKKIIKSCGLGSENKLKKIIKQKRYINYSSKEFETIEKLSDDMLLHGLVPGGWQYWGREKKINHILPLIDKCIGLREKNNV
jgi:hypothetical protein